MKPYVYDANAGNSWVAQANHENCGFVENR